jgi:thiol-disulfide isomerase/thioredoxin
MQKISNHHIMKNSSVKTAEYSLLMAGFLLLLMLSCKRQGMTDKLALLESDSASAVFKPAPQRLPEHHVQTLKQERRHLISICPMFQDDYQLSDFNDAGVLVIIFTCNHCPTAQAYEDRIIQFTTDYRDKGVSVAAIMPNSVYSLLPEECGYSDLDDTYESMIIRAKDKNFNFPYLYDGDNEAVSIQYGPTATPHAFVFNRNRELVYSGRLDASEKPGTGNADDLRAAVDALISGKPLSTAVNKAFGCSIKWAWKTEWTNRTNSDWNNKEEA